MDKGGENVRGRWLIRDVERGKDEVNGEKGLRECERGVDKSIRIEMVEERGREGG